MTPRDDHRPDDAIRPNDRAVLYDLVDRRLAPRAEDEVRRRLEDEPDLRLAYEQIVELRARLVALPVPALPADFLERVRARAGFPAAPAPAAVLPAAVLPAAVLPAAGPPTAVSPAAGRAEPAAAASPTDAASDGGVPRLGRVLSFARYAYAVAALLVVALGVAYWRWSEEDASPAATESARRDASSARVVASKSLATGREARASNEWKDSESAKDQAKPGAPTSAGLVTGGGGGGATPHFGPVGALPPGLRTPSDTPGDDRPPATPMPLDTGTGKDRTAANEGSFAKRKASSAEPQDPSGPAALAERPAPTSTATDAAMDDASAPPAEAAGARTGEPSDPTLAKSPARPGYALPAASVDADEVVLYVYADSFEAARAEVSIWVADARAGRTPDARRLAQGQADRLPAPADKKSEGNRRRDESDSDAPGMSSPTESASKASGQPASDAPRGSAPVAAPAAPGERMLGAFVVELEAPAFERLSRSLPGSKGIDDLLRAAGNARGVAAGETEQTPPKSDAAMSGDGMSGAGLTGAPPTESPPLPVPLPVPRPVPLAIPPPASAPAMPAPSAPSDDGDTAGMDESKLRAPEQAPIANPSVRRVRIVVLPSR